MTQDRSVTAGFDLISEALTVTAGVGGKVTSSPGGIDCGSDCDEKYGYGTQVTLTAVPDPGHVLALWAGACQGVPATSPTCTVTMDQAQTVTVRFAPQQFTFTLDFAGDGAGTVKVGATNYDAHAVFPVTYGQVLTLTPEPTNGIFWAWSGACSGNTACTVTVTGDMAAKATFLQSGYRYLVKATTATPNGIAFQVKYPAGPSISQDCTSSTTGNNCVGSLETGTVVQLVAHLPTVTSFGVVWNTLPTWQNCDSVSADGLTCTFTLLGFREVDVSADARPAP
jgi:hypothetical protein